MQVEHSYVSCGIKQLFGLKDERNWKPQLRAAFVRNRLYGEQVVTVCGCVSCVAMRERAEGRLCRFVIFSDCDSNRTEGVTPDSFGIRFAKYLEDQGLGKPTEISVGINPNTNNRIRLWSWEIPSKAVFDAWADKKD